MAIKRIMLKSFLDKLSSFAHQGIVSTISWRNKAHHFRHPRMIPELILKHASVSCLTKLKCCDSWLAPYLGSFLIVFVIIRVIYVFLILCDTHFSIRFTKPMCPDPPTFSPSCHFLFIRDGGVEVSSLVGIQPKFCLFQI
jgi:hypothetical protein